MKLIILLMLISTAGFSQPYCGIGYGNKGVSGYVGALIENVQIQASYKVPLQSQINPSIASFTAGYKVGNDFTFTPTVGIALSSGKDFTKYYAGGEIEKTKGTYFTYGGEVGYNRHIGRVFLAGDNFGYTVGIKMFFKQ